MPDARKASGVSPSASLGDDAEHHEQARDADRAEQDREQRRLAEAARDARPRRALEPRGCERARSAAAHRARRRAGGAARPGLTARRSRPRASRHAPRRARASRMPRTTPRARGPPPRAIVDATIATPTQQQCRAQQARGRDVGALHGGMMLARRRRCRSRRSGAPAHAARRVDDHPARALRQHGLERLAEQRRAGPARRQRHHQRPALGSRAPPRRSAGPPRPAAPSPSARSRAGRPAPAPSRSATPRSASCSGSIASIGEFGGTVIVTSTWMPRRRRAASLHRGRHRLGREVARPRTRPAPTRTRPRARPPAWA